MIILHRLPGAFGLGSVDPFCTKVETFLRLVGLEFRVHVEDVGHLPFGTVPFIVDRGQVVADSRYILEHCVQVYGRDPDGGLSSRQRTVGHMVRRTVEEHLRWGLLYARWIDDAGWRATRAVLQHHLAAPRRFVLPGVLRRRVRRALQAVGLASTDAPQVYAHGVADLDALASMLREAPFVLGESPSTVDATVYAFAQHVAATPTDNPLTRAVARHDCFAAYFGRVDAWMTEHEARPADELC